MLYKKNNLIEANRLEAFSDGVIAIIITIMVIEFHPPHGVKFNDLLLLLPAFLSYVLSFAFVAIYWNNHHHLLKAAKGVSAAIMWANMGLLFFLSLIPFVTAWMGRNHRAVAPTVCYGVVLLLSAIAYYILQGRIAKNLGHDSDFVKALGKDFKGKISPVLYIFAIFLGFFYPTLAQAIFVIVAVMWIIPDKRLEAAMNKEQL